jgi:predicted aldo/keto reductase-like oxidoreductase
MHMGEYENRISRRAMLKGLGMAGLGSLVTVSGKVCLASDDEENQSAQAPVVPTRPFGRSGVDVSALSLGGMFDIPNNQLLLRQALKWGVTYWDTADCYGGGKSEEGIGKFFSRNSDSRQRVFLVTKSDRRDPEGMSELLERSLRRMKTDYIDLYFIHGLSAIDEIDDSTRRWVEKEKSRGRIRLFGFSTHRNMERCMAEAAKLGWIDGIMMSYNFRLMHKVGMKDAVQACVEAGIGLTAMKTQGGGSVRTESEAELALAGRFIKRGYTDKQAKLKAVWENANIASICSQMPSLTVLMANVAAATDQKRLSAEEKESLERYARETACFYCAGCAEQCESAMETVVPISDIMRGLMYHHSYGDFKRGQRLFRTLAGKGGEQLREVDFSRAEARCPQGLMIGQLMEEATKLFA